MLEREGSREFAVDHVGPLDGVHGRVDGAERNDLQHHVRVQASLVGQAQALGERGHHGAHHAVYDELHLCARTHLAQVEVRLAHHIQRPRNFVVQRLVTGGHKDEAACLGGSFGARDRRLEVLGAGAADDGGNSLGGPGVHGGDVHVALARTKPRRGSLCACHRRLGGGHHHEGHLGSRTRLRGRGGQRGARIHQGLARGGGAVPHRQLVTGLHQVKSHWHAHDSGADESDGRGRGGGGGHDDGATSGTSADGAGAPGDGRREGSRGYGGQTVRQS
mmetsp:Transcript_36648/g.58864  ORF Transcript_36648/g.58864 Transcript_36648/m.58864 type:complete len:276 (+) Transcript_36648:280-1107(+)